jgi:hypothetical protein
LWDFKKLEAAIEPGEALMQALAGARRSRIGAIAAQLDEETAAEQTE